MSRLLLIFSHTLTAAQEQDAVTTLGVQTIVPMPDAVRPLWTNIPPDLDTVTAHLCPLEEWLRATGRPGDVVLIQGDFGAVYRCVTLCLELKMIPVYATTERKVVETPQPDGTVQTQRVFRHVRFRRYVPVVETDTE